MNPSLNILTLHSYGETAADDYRVTLSPQLIKMVAAKDGVAQGRPVKETRVLFIGEEEGIDLVLNEIDLLHLESVIGAYGFVEE